MARVLCVEIGYATTKLCEMDYKTKNPRVYQCIEIPTIPGAVKDGYLAEDKLEAMKKVLKAALAENMIRTNKVVFSVFSSKMITREVVLPAVKVSQIPGVIDANSSEYFPIEVEDYAIAHSLLATLEEGENAGRHKVLVYAAEKRLIMAYETLAEMCGWTVENIDYTGNAIYQGAKGLAGQQAQMYVRVEPENTIVSIVKNGKLAIQRVVNYGSGTDQEQQEDAQNNREMLIGAVGRIEDFYMSQDVENQVDAIYVIGQGVDSQGLIKELGSKLGIPCAGLAHMPDIKLQLSAGDVNLAHYASCIGAGYAPVGLTVQAGKNGLNINYFRTSILLSILFLVAGGAMVACSLLPYQEEQQRQQELQKLEETYTPAKALYERYNALTELFEYIDYGNKLTEHSNDGVLNFLEELEEKLPSDVRLTKFQSDDEQAVMTMTVADKETTAGVIDTLRAFDSIMYLYVLDVEDERAQEPTDADEVYSHETEFTIYCKYYPREYEEPLSADAITENTAAETVIE